MNNNTELILIRITGLDRPGLTASITEILSKYDVTILDIGQADIHSTLSLGILFKSQEKDSGNIMKELLFKASALGINIRFYPVTVEEYEEWVNMQGKNRYILTLLGRKLTAKQIAAVTGILAEQGLNIDAIKRLTGRIPLDERKANVRACIEFSVRGTPRQREEMQQALMKLSSDLEMPNANGNPSNSGQSSTNNGDYNYTDKSQFTWPVPGYYHISYGVGWRWGAYHKGIDIWSPGIRGAKICAAAEGTVILVSNTCTHDYGKNGSCGCGGGYGNYCIIDHGNGYWTLYGHSQYMSVTQGQHVNKGDVLGIVGSTGYSTGDHLHFEVRLNGVAQNPSNYV